MSSQHSKQPTEEAFLSTDFKEFIDSIQGANVVGNRFLDRLKARAMPDLMSVTPDLDFAERDLVFAEAFLERRREIDAHYGWVLASDAALVHKSVGWKSDLSAEQARKWMEGIHSEYERVGRAVLDAKLELENWSSGASVNR